MLKPILTNIPGQLPIELISYYPQFESYYPKCEMATKQWFVENARRDWVYLDCGANIGYYSILFSRLSPEGSIFAFEPTSTMEMLLANLKHHDVGNVHPVSMALGKTSGQINDKIFRIWGKDPEEAVYPFITIDDFVKFKKLTKLDCIKIDVDSFDFEVLQGARQALLDFDPYVMVELNHALAKRHQSVPEALEWLAGLGYESVTYFDHENCLLKRSASKSSLPKNKIEMHFPPSTAPDTPASLELDNAIARGETLFLQGEAGQALRFFEDLASSHPEDHRIYNDLGVIHHRLGNLKKALFVLGQGRAISPGDEDLILNQATVLAALGQYAKALDVCRQAPEAGERKQIASLAASLAVQVEKRPSSPDVFLAPEVPITRLHKELGFSQPLDSPRANQETPLDRWKMEVNDAPILRYLYRNFRPKRHLEFGTWQGAGTVYCLEESDATVWTINLPFGEERADGVSLYSGNSDSLGLNTSLAPEWARRIGLREQGSYRTDCFGFIGRFYLEKGQGHRVCQIYCDSTKWDDSAYPDGFFDSILIDGGHMADVVASDTRKALRLLKPGGLLLWHDFCPPVVEKLIVTRGVRDGVSRVYDQVAAHMRSLFWINPSWILVGLKK